MALKTIFGHIVALLTAFSALWAVQAGNINTMSDSEGEYDPLRAGERPKMFVDYLNGPLKGKIGLQFE